MIQLVAWARTRPVSAQPSAAMTRWRRAGSPEGAPMVVSLMVIGVLGSPTPGGARIGLEARNARTVRTFRVGTRGDRGIRPALMERTVTLTAGYIADATRPRSPDPGGSARADPDPTRPKVLIV